MDVMAELDCIDFEYTTPQKKESVSKKKPEKDNEEHGGNTSQAFNHKATTENPQVDIFALQAKHDCALSRDRKKGLDALLKAQENKPIGKYRKRLGHNH